MKRLLLTVACVALLGTGAMAQSRRRDEGEDKLPPSVPPPISTLTPTRGISGPRLEPGAVLCRTAEDLHHRWEVAERSSEGTPDAGNPLVGCRLLNRERGVEIVARQGPGQIEVRVKPDGEVGWTDAYVR